MKFLIFLFAILYSVKCEENSILIQANYYPESNTIEYNGQKYNLSPPPTVETLPPPPPAEHEVQRAIPFSGEFWFNLIVFVSLACFAGTMSGLTVGYLSIDSLVLEIKMSNGTETEKYYAEKIYKLVDNHHWLLVTLLLCNSFACEAMPIFLSKLVNEMMAIILSVTVLLFVGEIIPQALCTGPNQMKIASFLAPFTYFLMIITYPISYPIAMFMDYVIGVQGKNRYCNSDLKSIIELHMKEIIGGHQLGYFTGFLDVVNKTVGELILPLKNVTALDYHAHLNKITIKRLIDSGYSRIPVYKDNINNLIGILRMKELVGKNLSKSLTLEQLGVHLTNPIRVFEDTLFLDLFEKFKGGKSHMAFIYARGTDNNNNMFYSESIPFEYNKSYEKNIPQEKLIGIITLEDLIEFWLKIPIFDEEDYMQNKLQRRKSKRKRTFLDIIKNEKLNERLNLYVTRADRRENTIQSNNSFVFNNNYHPWNNQNDDENDKFL